MAAALKLRKKLPQLSGEEINGLVSSFKCVVALCCPAYAPSSLSTDGSGYLSKEDTSKSFVSQGYTYDETREALKGVSDSSGRVDVEEFAEIFARLKEGSAAATSTTAKAGKVKLGGATGSSAHTINEDERREFTNHINSVLAGDADIGARLPFDTETMQLFDECRDGLVLSKLVRRRRAQLD